ncbi:MAG: hypothetical protein U5L45_25135 [Saprospiraceae bacterium]|nr:hypothetical protein [Saprospiraceae bacterium]
MVHFSGFARKINHIALPRASEASARSIVWILSMVSNYFEHFCCFKPKSVNFTYFRTYFMYFRRRVLSNVVPCLLLAQRQEKRWFIFRLRRKMNHIPPFCASEASV